MSKIDVFNFHFTHLCNYKCKYCFAEKDDSCLSLVQCFKVVDAIEIYFIEEKIVNGRINLVGGEPLLYVELKQLIDRIVSKNIKVSIVTNGSLLTKEFIVNNREKIDTIGISVDSLRDDVNANIGRTNGNDVFSVDKIVESCKHIKKGGIQLKINTVVSAFNDDEDMNSFLSKVQPNRYKVFQMSINESINYDAKQYSVSDDKFKEFTKRHQEFCPIEETATQMSNSYLIINAKGDVVCKNHLKEEIVVGSALRKKIKELVQDADIDIVNYNRRYGI